MFHKKSEHLRRLLLVLDLSLSALVFLIVLQGYALIFPDRSLDRSSHLGLLLIILLVFGVIRKVFRMESTLHSVPLRSQAWNLAKEVLVTLIVVTGLIFLLKLDFVSRFVLLGFAIANILTLTAVRTFLVWWYFSKRREKRDNYLNVLIVGSGSRAHALADYIERSFEWGVNIIGFLDPKGESAGRRKEDCILGHVDQISELLRDNIVEEVIVAIPRSMLCDVQAVIDACEEEGVHLRFMADIYDFHAARVRLTMLNDVPLLSFEPVARAENALIAKRIFDLVVTIIALPLLAPRA